MVTTRRTFAVRGRPRPHPCAVQSPLPAGRPVPVSDEKPLQGPGEAIARGGGRRPGARVVSQFGPLVRPCLAANDHTKAATQPTNVHPQQHKPLGRTASTGALLGKSGTTSGSTMHVSHSANGWSANAMPSATYVGGLIARPAPSKSLLEPVTTPNTLRLYYVEHGRPAPGGKNSEPEFESLVAPFPDDVALAVAFREFKAVGPDTTASMAMAQAKISWIALWPRSCTCCTRRSRRTSRST